MTLQQTDSSRSNQQRQAPKSSALIRALDRYLTDRNAGRPEVVEADREAFTYLLDALRRFENRPDPEMAAKRAIGILISTFRESTEVEFKALLMDKTAAPRARGLAASALGALDAETVDGTSNIAPFLLQLASDRTKPDLTRQAALLGVGNLRPTFTNAETLAAVLQDNRSSDGTLVIALVAVRTFARQLENAEINDAQKDEMTTVIGRALVPQLMRWSARKQFGLVNEAVEALNALLAVTPPVGYASTLYALAVNTDMPVLLRSRAFRVLEHHPDRSRFFNVDSLVSLIPKDSPASPEVRVLLRVIAHELWTTLSSDETAPSPGLSRALNRWQGDALRVILLDSSASDEIKGEVVATFVRADKTAAAKVFYDAYMASTTYNRMALEKGLLMFASDSVKKVVPDLKKGLERIRTDDNAEGIDHILQRLTVHRQ